MNKIRGSGRYYGPGVGLGHFRGYGRGFGWDDPVGHSGWYCEAAETQIKQDYEYLGPCRCGCGPDAFYRDRRTGRISRGFPYRFRKSPETSEERLKDELEYLRQEKEKLEKWISEIEEILRPNDE